MDNELQVTTPETITELPEAKQKGWIKVGIMKANLKITHEQKGLGLQAILLNSGKTILEREESLKKYRTEHTTMVSDGQAFRKLITEKVLQESIEIEKQYDPKTNADYTRMQNGLVADKLKQQQDNQATQAKEQERNNYIAHIKNQYEILIADYKKRAVTELYTMYNNFLKGKVKTPDVQAIKDVISEMTLGKPQKFTRQYVTDVEATTIVAAAAKPDFAKLQAEMLKEVDLKFTTYKNDLKAGAQEQVELFGQKHIQEIETEAQQNVAVNTLQAQATPVTVMMEGKALKQSVQIVEEDSEGWAVKVITGFMKYPLCRGHLRVRKWPNLSVGQMAAALSAYASETGERVQGLEYKEVVK